jgi:hypothetical protein
MGIVSLSYFAGDGNFGDADKITIIDTTTWTEEDWYMIDQVSDGERYLAARTISEWIEDGRGDDYDAYFERLGIERKTSS